MENIQVTNTPASEQARFRAVDVTRDTETKAVLRVGCPGPSVWCWSRKRFNQTGSNARRKGEWHNLAMLTVNTQVTNPSLTTSCLAPAGLPTVGDRKWPCFLLRRTWFFQSRRAAKTATGDVEPKAGTGVEAQSFYFYSSPSNWTSHSFVLWAGMLQRANLFRVNQFHSALILLRASCPDTKKMIKGARVQLVCWRVRCFCWDSHGNIKVCVANQNFNEQLNITKPYEHKWKRPQSQYGGCITLQVQAVIRWERESRSSQDGWLIIKRAACVGERSEAKPACQFNASLFSCFVFLNTELQLYELLNRINSKRCVYTPARWIFTSLKIVHV